MYLKAEDSALAPPRITGNSFILRDTLLEQGSGVENEDSLSTANGVYIVCDGATSLAGKRRTMPVSGGKQAALLTAQAFSTNQGSLIDMAMTANQEISEAMRVSGLDFTDRSSLWSTSFAALRFRKENLEWAQSGDCSIILLYDDGTSKMVTKLPGHDTDTLKKWQQIGTTAGASIHEVLARDISAVRKKMNREYGVLNGEPEALSFIDGGVERTERVTDILLFSDGFWLPSQDPAQPLDHEALAKMYRSGGLSTIRDYIRFIQKKDVNCVLYPRFKKHDDMSVIALSRNS